MRYTACLSALRNYYVIVVVCIFPHLVVASDRQIGDVESWPFYMTGAICAAPSAQFSYSSVHQNYPKCWFTIQICGSHPQRVIP